MAPGQRRGRGRGGQQVKRQPYSGTLRALLVEPGVVFRHTPGQPVRVTVGGRHFEAANAPAAAALAADLKRLETLRARAALLGGRLDLIESDGGGAEIVLTYGAATHRYQSLGDVEAAMGPQRQIAVA